MKNAQPHTNAEPSALVQRNSTRYLAAVQFIAYVYSLSKRSTPLSRKAIAERIATNRLPQSFEPVGDGVHVIPVAPQRMIVGYPGGLPATPENMLRANRLWLPEWGIDRRWLILDSFLWIDADELTARSPIARQRLALRAARALTPLNFPHLRGRYPTADRQLRAEIATKAKKWGAA